MVDCDQYFKVTLHDGTIDDVQRRAKSVKFNSPVDGFVTLYDDSNYEKRNVLTVYAMNVIKKIEIKEKGLY